MNQAPPSRLPLIGITADSSGCEQTGSKTNQEGLYSLASRYCDAVENAGGLPIIIPHSRSRTQIHSLLTRIDGLLISGGGFDIDPAYYDEQPIARLGKINSQRTFTELESIAFGLDRDLPMLGICGGAQAINVALGGSLYQDIATQLPAAQKHQQEECSDENGHVVEVMRGTLLYKICDRRTLGVNTTHHQAIRNLGEGLAINATAPDGVIEGIESKKHSFVLGLQWHPELLAQSEAVQRKIFSSFVLACRRLHSGTSPGRRSL
jgi:putative glutamine amidotransferase